MQFDVNDYRTYYTDLLCELMAVPSPSGYWREVMELVRRKAEENGASFSLTRKGCGIITVKGASEGEALGACAHCDTLGAMVRSVDAGGGINFTVVGGPQLPTLDGEYCTVITGEGKKYTGTILSKSPASHVYSDAKTRERSAENMYVRLDEVVKTAEDVRALGIENGDYICFDPKTAVTESGYIKSRFLDDKASVACLITCVHILHEKGIVPPRDLKILVTMYEEVGHGAAFIPDGICEMLGVDMGCIGEDLSCTEHDVSICAKDSGGPYDYAMTKRLISLAKENGLSYAVDIYPYYGSDVEAMWRAGYDVPGALIGTGVHASHGMERTHLDGVFNTVALILLYFGV